MVTAFGLTTQIHADPWYNPRFALPILGMILGTTMNGVSLVLERLVSGAVLSRNAIVAQLMLGAHVRGAMRAVYCALPKSVIGNVSVGIVVVFASVKNSIQSRALSRPMPESL